MSVWDREYDEYIMKYWGHSSIDWQQENREILNEAIRVYNKYIRNLASLEEVKDAIYFAEDRLRDECGDYMDDIDKMKYNVDKVESDKEEDIYE